MADTKAERGKAIEIALAQIEKQFGKGAIMRLGDKKVADVTAISTGSLSIDASIGVGGFEHGSGSGTLMEGHNLGIGNRLTIGAFHGSIDYFRAFFSRSNSEILLELISFCKRDRGHYLRSSIERKEINNFH